MQFTNSVITIIYCYLICIIIILIFILLVGLNGLLIDKLRIKHIGI